jgi:hypothetical protein
MKIEVREFVKRGANGDRDTSGGVEYSDYEVVLVADDGRENKLKSVNGYDNFWTMPHDRAETRKEAMDYAKKQAAFFGAKVVVVKMRKKAPKPQKEEWVRA